MAPAHSTHIPSRLPGGLRILTAACALLATGCAGRATLLGTVVPPDGKTAGLQDAVVYAVPTGGEAPEGKVMHRQVAWTRKGFTPRELILKDNTRVTFRNEDSVYHNAFSLSPAMPFDVGRFGPGESRSVLFDRPGVFEVFCELHPDYSGVIVVVPRHEAAHPDSRGRVRLPLAAGTYTVTVWHPVYGVLSRTVRVPRSGEVPLGLEYR